MLKCVNNFHICKYVNYGKIPKLNIAIIKFMQHHIIYTITDSYIGYYAQITTKL